MDSKESEEEAKGLLNRFGFAVEKLETKEREAMDFKTAGFRADHPEETWVIEVKERRLDSVAERRLDSGEMVPQTARTDDDPNEHFMALRAYRGAVEQIRDTRNEAELAAVWFVLNEHPSKTLDTDQLLYGLLGKLEILITPFPNTRTVYEVHEPEFGMDVDALVLQERGGINVLLNPWTKPERLARARASHFVRCARKVTDPREEMNSGRSWVAPPSEVARELCRQYLATLNTDKTLDSYEGRKRREFHVQCALRHLYGPGVQSFAPRTVQVVSLRIPSGG